MAIAEPELRQWVHRVVEGKASRRQFMRTMLRLGLSAPFVANLLATYTPAAAQAARVTPSSYTPAKRGGGGRLRLLWWQAPTIANPHLSTGTKDYDASRVVHEPLAAFNRDGEFIPILAAEIPSFDNGGLSRDGTAVSWRLKKGVVWHDGKPFTADDVIFTWEYAVDRRIIAEQLYGAAGQPTSNLIDSPSRFQSPHTSWEFNNEKAAQWLDQAGWTRGSDGFRVKAGRRMKILYQTSVNPVRQKTQAIVKKAFEQLGIEVELKAVNAGVYFSSDPANPDTVSHFYADIQMFTFGPGSPDPQAHLNRFVSWQIAQKANNWSRRNVVRWSNAEYDRVWKQAETELDPVRRAALIIRMNDLLIEDVVLIPLVWRNGVRAVSHKLHGMELSDWDSDFWDLAYWYREA